MNFDKIDELIEKYKAKPGFKSKIIANCISCTVDPKGHGTWRQQVEDCTVTRCPLYEVRPVSEGGSR